METEKYAPIRKQASFIAKVCGCSDAYVRAIFKGARRTGTERAVMAGKVVKVADELLETYYKHTNKFNQPNN